MNRKKSAVQVPRPRQAPQHGIFFNIEDVGGTLNGTGAILEAYAAALTVARPEKFLRSRFQEGDEYRFYAASDLEAFKAELEKRGISHRLEPV